MVIPSELPTIGHVSIIQPLFPTHKRVDTTSIIMVALRLPAGFKIESKSVFTVIKPDCSEFGMKDMLAVLITAGVAVGIVQSLTQ